MFAANRFATMNARMVHQSKRMHTTLRSVGKTIKEHPNNGLKYLGGAATLGLGAMIAYGLSRPTQYVPSATRSTMMSIGGPSYAKMVRSRIAKTYGYLCGSVLMTGTSAYLLFTRGVGYRLLTMNPMVFGIGALLATWGMIHLTMSIDGKQNPMGKHLAWMGLNALMGLSLVSLGTMAGAEIVKQAALGTGVIVGSMSALAMVSPGDSFLNMGPYLGVGLGVVIAASLGGMLFPQSSMLFNISLYGGLGLFGLYSAHDAARVLHNAQTQEYFDPINMQMGLYMDSINIFVRLVQILMMQQGGRRR